jgi:hypothetical protein
LNSSWYQSSGRSVWQIGISGSSVMPEEGTDVGVGELRGSVDDV